MVHDFAITERYLVFLLMPMKFNGRPGLSSPLPHYRWLDGAPLVTLLVDKADWRVQRFELPGTGLFHLANAWEERGTVQVRFVAQPEVLHALRQLNVAGRPARRPRRPHNGRTSRFTRPPAKPSWRTRAWRRSSSRASTRPATAWPRASRR